jgi:hypothetical protein
MITSVVIWEISMIKYLLGRFLWTRGTFIGNKDR